MKGKILKLNKKDRKILFSLDFNSRRSLSSIAREVGLSKQGVDYKIQSLIKKGVITNFYPMVDITKLGYYYCRFMFKLHNMTREKEQKIMKEMVRHKNCIWSLKMEGAYDFAMALALNNLAEFKKISEYFLGKYGKYIQEKKESIAVDVVHFQNKFLLEKKKGLETTLGGDETKLKIDNIDWKIIRLLCKDASLSLADIGNKLKISPKVASYRMKRMKDNKIIMGYRPNINHELIGYYHYKILFYLTNVTKEEYQKFRAYISSHPSLIYIVDEIGISDIDLEIMLPKEKRVFEFIEELKFKFPHLIKNYDISLVTKTLKVAYVPEK